MDNSVNFVSGRFENAILYVKSGREDFLMEGLL